MIRLRKSAMAVAGCYLLLLSLSTAARGDPNFTITSGDASFSLRSIPNDPTGIGAFGDLTIGGNPDHLYQTWWWYRLAGDTRESAFNSANPNWDITAGGKQATADFALPNNLSSTMSWFIDKVGASAVVDTSLAITNNTNTPVTLQLFHYLDLDLGGTPGDDSAVYQGGVIRITDPNWRAVYLSGSTASYAVGEYPSIRDLLTNANVDNFNNTGLPFGPGDWTGGWEYQVNIDAFGTTRVRATFAVAPTPEPSTLGICAITLVICAYPVRRRKGIV